MVENIKILLLEDNCEDVELITIELRKTGFLFSLKVVETERDFLNALKNFVPDLILADYTLPSYDGLTALLSAREQYSEVPYIFISGTIGEEKAIEAMRSGATDYVLKENLSKLIPAVQRALREAEERHKRLVAEEGMMNSAREWKATFDAIDDAVCLLGADGKILRCNKAMAKFLGKSFDAIIGGTCWELLHKTKEPIPECPVLRMKETRQRETMLLRSNEKIFQVIVDPILDEKDEIIQVAHIISDITEQKRTEKKLRDSAHDLSKRIKELNCLYKITQISAKKEFAFDAAAQKIVDLIPASFEYPENVCIKLLIDGQEYKTDNFQNTSRHQNCDILVHGDCIGVLTVYCLEKNSKTDGYLFLKEERHLIESIAGHLGQLLESNRAEKALRESEERYRNLYNAIPAMQHSIDNDGRLISVSDFWLKKLGYERDEVIKKKFIDFLTENSRQDALEVYLPRFYKDGYINDVPFQFVKKNGDIVDVLLSAVSETDRYENITRAIAVSIDVTDRKKLEAKLIQAQKMESIGILAGGIAHDFNNILSAILGFTELSLDDVEKKSVLKDDLKEIYAGGIRAKELVKQILMFARQSDQEFSPIMIGLIAKEVLKFLRSSIPTTIEIKSNIQSSSLIMGNSTQVHQIFMNLFTNAAHAMEEKGGTLDVSLNDVVVDKSFEMQDLGLKPGNYIEIKVSDTGCGIPPDIIDKIFEPYFTTKTIGEGTGMGLAIIHGIIKDYGGNITVHSTLGKGSIFIVMIPTTQQEKVHKPYETDKLPCGTENILFVDDEKPIVKMGAKILEKLGYTVSTRTDSVEALELFRQNPKGFDLVITDMTMPTMTGDKLATELIKIKPDIPVILCTGYSKKVSEKKSAYIGISAFANKPIEKKDLARTIRKVLDKAKSAAQG